MKKSLLLEMVKMYAHENLMRTSEQMEHIRLVKKVAKENGEVERFEKLCKAEDTLYECFHELSVLSSKCYDGKLNAKELEELAEEVKEQAMISFRASYFLTM